MIEGICIVLLLIAYTALCVTLGRRAERRKNTRAVTGYAATIQQLAGQQRNKDQRDALLMVVDLLARISSNLDRGKTDDTSNI